MHIIKSYRWFPSWTISSVLLISSCTSVAWFRKRIFLLSCISSCCFSSWKTLWCPECNRSTVAKQFLIKKAPLRKKWIQVRFLSSVRFQWCVIMAAEWVSGWKQAGPSCLGFACSLCASMGFFQELLFINNLQKSFFLLRVLLLG